MLSYAWLHHVEVKHVQTVFRRNGWARMYKATPHLEEYQIRTNVVGINIPARIVTLLPISFQKLQHNLAMPNP